MMTSTLQSHQAFQAFQSARTMAPRVGTPAFRPNNGGPGLVVRLRHPFKSEMTIARLSELTPARLRQLGDIRGVILDMDDTVIPRHAEDVQADMVKALRALKQTGFQVGIVTNNNSADYCRLIRSRMEANGLHLPWVENAIKPTREGLEDMRRYMNLRPDQIAEVGDNRFTDTFGARLEGMQPVLAQWYFKPTGPLHAAKHYTRQFCKLVKREYKHFTQPNFGPRCINFDGATTGNRFQPSAPQKIL